MNPSDKRRVMLPGYVKDCFRSRKKLLVWFFVTSIGRTVSALATILVIQQILTAMLNQGGGLSAAIGNVFGASRVVWVMAGLLLGTILSAAWLHYLNEIVTQRAVEALELGLMDRLIRHLLTLSVQYFDRRTHGDILQAIRQDVTQLRIMVATYASVLLQGMLVLGMLLLLLRLSPFLLFWSMVAVPLAVGPVLYLATKRMRAVSGITRASGYVLFDVVLQILTGIRIIKAYQAEETEATSSIVKGKIFFGALMKAVRIRAWGEVLLETTGGVSFVMVIVIGTFQVTRGSLTWPALLAFAMAARSLFLPLFNLCIDYLNIPAYHASMERIDQLLNTKPLIRDCPNPQPLTSGPDVIAFDIVSFSYGGAAELEDISFLVRAGETIGIVGPSGTGKSTFLNLIVRFFDPTSGRVLFDGRDLRDLRLADVHRQVAIVTQDPFLFATTVRENIRCGRPNASDMEIIAAAQGAFIHEEIMELPSGYDTQIGAGGRELSRGQAQRINVARALLKSAPILLLDEATSSLDSVAEAEVQRSIDHLMEDRTCFVVAHRLSTLRNADRILVLDAGRCVGLGTHQELLADSLLYRQLWELQNLGVGSPAELAPVLSTGTEA
jgi:ABC-type multidrug transport system fused ATPase/permease subunit